MKRIVPMMFVAALTLTGTADAVERCENISDRGLAGTQQRRSLQAPPVALALMGLALFATGAVTRRSTIERA